jgi:hypothetical protein
VFTFKKQWAVPFVAMIAIFAVTATSYSKKTAYENQYTFSESRKVLMEKMSNLINDDVTEWFSESNLFEIVFDDCIGRATITVSENLGVGVIRLNEIDFRCPSPPSADEMRDFFEKEFIDKLKEDTPKNAGKIKYILATRSKDAINVDQKQNGSKPPKDPHKSR